MYLCDACIEFFLGLINCSIPLFTNQRVSEIYSIMSWNKMALLITNIVFVVLKLAPPRNRLGANNHKFAAKLFNMSVKQ